MEKYKRKRLLNEHCTLCSASSAVAVPRARSGTTLAWEPPCSPPCSPPWHGNALLPHHSFKPKFDLWIIQTLDQFDIIIVCSNFYRFENIKQSDLQTQKKLSSCHQKYLAGISPPPPACLWYVVNIHFQKNLRRGGNVRFPILGENGQISGAVSNPRQCGECDNWRPHPLGPGWLLRPPASGGSLYF